MSLTNSRPISGRIIPYLILLISLQFNPPVQADALRVLPPGSKTLDRRVTDIKTLNTDQDFSAPRFFEDWTSRKEHLRKKILVSTGLMPFPEIGDLHVEIFGKKTYEDYTVEKVLLRTYPGYYATGNLFRPIRKAGSEARFPGILCPHGHWSRGRLEDNDRASVPRRGVSFAKQGYVCFTYDMVGYADNREFLKHDFAGKREDLWGITPVGIQLLTSIRALDFLQSLEDVDPDKIGCTGASGGGTQTFLLSAVDDRVKISAPVNMISSTMQGGCICENAPGLRLDSNNMEIGALAAPRPQMMVSASGDWTKKTPYKEFPAVQSVYRLYGVPQRVETHQEDAGHNYNLASRNVVYEHFRRFFYPNRPPQDFIESANLEIGATEELQIFPGRTRPADALPAEDLFAGVRSLFEEQLWGTLESGLEAFDDSFGESYRITLAVREPDADEIEIGSPSEARIAGRTVEKFLLKNPGTGQVVPANLWLPSSPSDAEGNPVLLVHGAGKGALLSASETLSASLEQYLAASRPVLSIDCLASGEYLDDASSTTRSKGVSMFPTYNLTDLSCRVQDILLGEIYLKERFGLSADIVGIEGAGPWVLLAHGFADQSRSTHADLTGFDFEEDRAFIDSLFIPNLKRAGDFATSVVIGRERSVEWTGLAEGTMSERLAMALASIRTEP